MVLELPAHAPSRPRRGLCRPLRSLLLWGVIVALAPAARDASLPVLSLWLLDVVSWTLVAMAWCRGVVQVAEPTLASTVSWSSAHTRFAPFLAFWRLPWLVLGWLRPSAGSTEQTHLLLALAVVAWGRFHGGGLLRRAALAGP